MKVYVLKYYYNEYEQLDGYVEAIFKGKPTFHDVKAFYAKGNDQFGYPDAYLENAEAFFGKLARGELVYQFVDPTGGDYWVIEEIEIY